MSRLWFAILLECAVLAGPVRAGTFIEFPNVSERAQPARLLGYLARPTGDGAFPAVVVLHDCGGFSSHDTDAADRLTSWGYAALAVDSFGPRGITRHCHEGMAEQATDAFAALDYLAQLPFIDPQRIAVLGYSMGAHTALSVVERGLISQLFKRRFRAAIAYYPWCQDDIGATMEAPVMIMIGGSDDWTLAEDCRRLVAQPHEGGTAVDLTVYPGAYHAFDYSNLKPGVRANGHWLEYNEAAAVDAREKVRAFLGANLGIRTEPAAR